MNKLLSAVVCLLMLGGCSVTAGHLLGKPKADTDKTAISGKVVEVCPTAGCWFRIKTDKGIVRIELKNAGFVATGIPIGTDVQAWGTTNTKTGDLEANGLSYQ